MFEFGKEFETPLAQKQQDLEEMIKIYEIERAKNISRLLYGLTAGFGYVLIMGGLIGYGTFPGGYVLSGWLSVITCGLLTSAMGIVPLTEMRSPDLGLPDRLVTRRKSVFDKLVSHWYSLTNPMKG